MDIDEAKEYLEEQGIDVDLNTAKWHIHDEEGIVDCSFWSDKELIEYVTELKEASNNDDLSD
jgi:hypothetical protein